MAGNSFLTELAALERGQYAQPDANSQRVSIAFVGADLESLRSAGLRWASVDRVAFTFEFQDLVHSYHDLFNGLFGDPVLYGTGVKVWDISRYGGQTSVQVRPFSWPSGAADPGPDMPRSGRRPQSPVLGDVP